MAGLVRLLRWVWVPCLWLLLWQGAALAVGEELLLPAPAAVLREMAALPFSGVFWQSCCQSLGRILLGLLLGTMAGGLLAVASACFAPARAFLAPAMAAIKATPVASFVILALVWVRGEALSVFISLLMVLPMVWQNVSQGIAGADRQLLELAAVYRLPLWRRLRGIYLPAVAPHLLSALRVGVGFAWKAGIAGEVIAIAPRSIGYALYTAKTQLEMPALFAWTGYIILLSLGLEKGMMALVGRMGRRRRGREGA